MDHVCRYPLFDHVVNARLPNRDYVKLLQPYVPDADLITVHVVAVRLRPVSSRDSPLAKHTSAILVARDGVLARLSKRGPWRRESSMREVALRLAAEEGLFVFPCRPRAVPGQKIKSPYTEHGKDDATAIPRRSTCGGASTLMHWWGSSPASATSSRSMSTMTRRRRARWNSASSSNRRGRRLRRSGSPKLESLRDGAPSHLQRAAERHAEGGRRAPADRAVPGRLRHCRRDAPKTGTTT